MTELNIVKPCIWGLLLHITEVANASSTADSSLGHEKENDKKRQKRGHLHENNISEKAIRWCRQDPLKVSSSRDNTKAISLIERKIQDKTFHR